jgi:hypothetical protein
MDEIQNLEILVKEFYVEDYLIEELDEMIERVEKVRRLLKAERAKQRKRASEEVPGT